MPPNATRRPAAAAASTMMPFENTSRSPRCGELAGQVAVLGDDRRQAREAVVRGVRGEDEDRGGGELQEHERGPVAEHRQAELRDHRPVVARVRLEVVREERHAEEQRAEQHAHPHERGGRVLRLGTAERGHAVGDRLDPGERDRARREALEQQEDAERPAATPGSPSNASGSNGTVATSPKNDWARPTTMSAPRITM